MFSVCSICAAVQKSLLNFEPRGSGTRPRRPAPHAEGGESAPQDAAPPGPTMLKKCRFSSYKMLMWRIPLNFLSSSSAVDARNQKQPRPGARAGLRAHPGERSHEALRGRDAGESGCHWGRPAGAHPASSEALLPTLSFSKASSVSF